MQRMSGSHSHSKPIPSQHWGESGKGKKLLFSIIHSFVHFPLALPLHSGSWGSEAYSSCLPANGGPTAWTTWKEQTGREYPPGVQTPNFLTVHWHIDHEVKHYSDFQVTLKTTWVWSHCSRSRKLSKWKKESENVFLIPKDAFIKESTTCASLPLLEK